MTDVSRIDTDALTAAAIRLAPVRDEANAVHGIVTGVFGDMGAAVPSAILALPAIAVDLETVHRDILQRVQRALYDPHENARADHWSRTWHLRLELDHLGEAAAAALANRLPEADRHDSPVAALARMAASDSATVSQILHELVDVLDDIQPVELTQIADLLEAIGIPAPAHIPPDAPIAILLAIAAVAVRDGAITTDVSNAISVAVAGAMVAAIQGGMSPEDVIDTLGPDILQDGGLLTIVPHLPATIAAGLLGALLDSPAAGGTPVPLYPDLIDQIRVLLLELAAAPMLLSDVDLALLLKGLAERSTFGDLDMLRPEVLALLVAVQDQLLSPGFLDMLRPGGAITPAMFDLDALRRIVTLASGTMIAESLLLEVALDGIRAIHGNGDRDALYQLGLVAGILIDQSQDLMETMRDGRQSLYNVVEPILTNIPGIGDVVAIVFEIINQALTLAMSVPDLGDRDVRARRQLTLILGHVAEEVAALTGSEDALTDFDAFGNGMAAASLGLA